MSSCSELKYSVVDLLLVKAVLAKGFFKRADFI